MRSHFQLLAMNYDVIPELKRLPRYDGSGLAGVFVFETLGIRLEFVIAETGWLRTKTRDAKI